MWLRAAFEDGPAENCGRVAVFLGCLEFPSETHLEASSRLFQYLIMALGVDKFPEQAS